MTSAWAVLGVPEGATLGEIRSAYRARALATHPDHGGEPDEFRAVKRAYERLVARLVRKGARGR